MNVLGLVPARGGSKGIPNKNIVPCGGRPLLGWTAEAAHGSKLLNRIILSSNSQAIADVAREWGIEVPFMRSEELSQDDTPALPVITHAVEWMEREEDFWADIIVLLQPTSPLRLARHIDEAVQMLLGDPDADSVVSVTDVPHQYAPGSVMVAKGDRVVPWMPQDETSNLRQIKPKFLARNGAAIYAFRRNCLFKKGSIFGDHILGYRMSAEESIDLDSTLELKICDMLLRERQSMRKNI